MGDYGGFRGRGSRGGGRGGFGSRGGFQGGFGGGPSAYESYGGHPGGGYGGYRGGDGGYSDPGWGQQGQQGYGGHGGFGVPPGGFLPGGPGYGYGAPSGPETAPSPLDEEIQLVMSEMGSELAAMDQAGEWADQFKNARRLLIAEKDRLENSIDPEWLEVDIIKPIKVTKKILIPVYRYPKFNFVGKILGPKGATLQNLCKTYKCHIYVLGRGSTKDIHKEQELLMTNDRQYAHYGGPLHVKVETVAPSQVAYKRVSGVIEELSRILQPVREDTTPEFLKDKEENSGGDPEGDKKSDIKHENRGSGGPMRGRGGGGFRGGRGGFSGRGSAGRPQPY